MLILLPRTSSRLIYGVNPASLYALISLASLRLLMPIKQDRSDPKLQKAFENFGAAILRYRELNGLAQQDFHEFGQATKAPLHNSQIAYLESGRLDPKFQVLLSLEKFNNSIADHKIPAARGKFTKERRDRLKNADPFYTHDGRIATATDYFSMMIGQQEINKKYTTNEELTDKFIADYFKMRRQIFIATATEQMISNHECWEALAKSKAMKAVKEKELIKQAQEALRGEFVPSIKEARYVMTTYHECPMCEGMREIAGHELPKKFETAHSKLMALAR